MATRRQLRTRMVIGLSSVLALLIALIGTILFNDHRKQSEYLSASNAEVSRMLIERQGHATLIMEKRVDQWILTEPCELPISTSRIDPLLGALSNVAGSYHRDEVDLPETGLLDPEVTATIDDIAIAIGAMDSSGERRYALRGDRVGFVPEWVLSLANGGISAIAQLELFSSPITQLGDLPADKLPAWQALAASQIVLWPVSDAPPELSRRTLALEMAEGVHSTLQLIRNERYTAIQLGNSECAYIFPNDDIPQ